jgi:hypothetical protein
MAGPSTSRALMEVEQITMLNEVLDDKTLSNYSSDDDSASDYDFNPVHSRPSVQPLPKRLTERHFLERILPMGKKARPDRRCVVCTKRARGKNLIIGL